MKLVVPALLLFTAVGCLSVVDERWCGPSLPCTQGFVCTSTFHCVRPSEGGGDGGTGGGRNDGGTGGGMGGDGGRACDAVSCASGCCLRDTCVPTTVQSHGVCGFLGDTCRACSLGDGCVDGSCQPVISADAGISVDAGFVSPVGGACTQDFDCGNSGTEFCFPEFSGGMPTGFIGGYCSRRCDDQLCPPNAACLQAETGNGDIVNICLATCSTGDSCRMGYQCDSQGGPGVCVP